MITENTQKLFDKCLAEIIDQILSIEDRQQKYKEEM